MYTRFLFFYFLLFTFSCSNHSKGDSEKINDNGSVITINISQIQNEGDYQSIFSTVDSILLEESENLIIGQIDKIVLTDSFIFISDRKKARDVFMYHTNGSFIKSIGDTGNGIGEYLSPDGLCIDSKNNEIIILDKNSRVFLFYDFNGEFIRNIKFDGFVNDFSLYNKNKLIIDSGNMPDGLSHCLTIIDKQTGEIESKIFPKDLTVQNMPFMSLYPLTSSRDKIIYQPSMNNSIYEIDNDSIQCKYKIDFGKYWPSKKELEQLKGLHPQIIVDELKKNYVLYPSLLETDQTIFVSFTYEDNIFTFFKNKENSVRKLFIWDKDSDLSLPLGVVNNQFISVKYSETLPPMLLFYKVKL